MSTHNTRKVILAGNERQARIWCAKEGLDPNEVVIVRSIRTIEGLRYYPEDIVYVGSWARRSDIEEIKEVILRSSVCMPSRED